MQSFRQGIRSLLKSPVLTFTGIFLLAVGIGLNTALFSLFNAALLSPFPYSEPDRLVLVSGAFPEQGVDSTLASYPDFEAIQERATAFDAVAVFGWRSFNLTVGDEPMSLGGAWVSSDFFSVLGIEPLLGRTFSESEASPAGDRVVVLNERIWRTLFGADEGILGRTVRVNGEPRVVIGVMPMKAELAQVARFWLPVEQQPQCESRSHRFLRGIARLRPGATVEEAEVEVTTIGTRLQAEFPEENQGFALTAETLREAWFGGARQVLQVLLAMVLLVLLIACANLTILMLVRAENRSRDLALRTALGATSGTLVRQTVTESLILGVVGCVLGLGVGSAAARLLMLSMPIELPVWFELRTDARVVAFTVAVALLAVIAFSLIPILRARKPNLSELAQEGGRETGGPRGQRLQRTLIGAELAFSLALLVSCGLMAKSFVLVTGTRPGFDPEGALTFGLHLESTRYADDAHRIETLDRILERTAGVAGVDTVGAVSYGLPLQVTGPSRAFVVEGRPPADPDRPPVAIFQSVTPEYFEAMRIDLLRGRVFTRSDTSESLPVAVVDRELAGRFWPDGSPEGRRVRVLEGEVGQQWRTVVGVVESVRQDGLDQALRPTIYVPFHQVPEARLSVVARTAVDPVSLGPALRRTVAEVAPAEPLRELATLQEVVEDSLWQWRFFSALFWVAAGVALLLASVGLYGVTAYSMAKKTREIGIRLAMGAERGDVLRLMLRQGLTVVLVGLLVGLGMAWFLGRAMGSFLYGVGGGDPVVYVLALLLLTTVATGAILVPSVRASRVPPQTALRIQ